MIKKIFYTVLILFLATSVQAASKLDEIKKNGELWINFNGQDVLNLVDNAIQKFS